MKKLTVVIEEFNTSGGLRVVTAVANVAAQVGCAVTLICPDYGGQVFFPIHPAVQIRKLVTGRSWRRLRYVMAVARERLFSPHVFLTTSYRLINVITLMGMLARRPHPLLLIQGLDRISLIDLAPTPIFARWINRQLLRISQIMPCDRIFVSTFLQLVLKKKGTLIPNFVAPVFLEPRGQTASSTTNNIRIGYIGSMAPNKGFDVFLDACQQLNDSTTQSSPFSIEFACVTQDHALIQHFSTSCIEFICPTSDMELKDFYQSCDIFLSLSISEGFCLPALEAMACGCVVICSNSGGVTDFVCNRENGIILDERSGSAVAIVVRKLLSDAALRCRLAEEGRTTAQQYSYTRFHHNYRLLFHNLGLINV